MPDDDLSHFVIEAVAALSLDNIKVNRRGTGDTQYPPAMMLRLLIYCYATGLISPRRIERTTWQNVSVRFLCGDTHPDHDTLCTFRRHNDPLLAECFVKTLELARELKLPKLGTVAIDGTKIPAHASQHAAHSYQKAGELITTLEAEVADLIAKAEDTDSTPLEDGLTIPKEPERSADVESVFGIIKAAMGLLRAAPRRPPLRGCLSAGCLPALSGQ